MALSVSCCFDLGIGSFSHQGAQTLLSPGDRKGAEAHLDDGPQLYRSCEHNQIVLKMWKKHWLCLSSYPTTDWACIDLKKKYPKKTKIILWVIAPELDRHAMSDFKLLFLFDLVPIRSFFFVYNFFFIPQNQQLLTKSFLLSHFQHWVEPECSLAVDAYYLPRDIKKVTYWL